MRSNDQAGRLLMDDKQARTPHENLLLDIALDRLEELFAKRASILREQLTVAIVQAAVVIVNTAADLPGFGRAPHWFVTDEDA